MKTREEVITTVKSFKSGKQGSKLVTIPREIRDRLGDENTDFFIVGLDRKGRIIFEPIRRKQASTTAISE